MLKAADIVFSDEMPLQKLTGIWLCKRCVKEIFIIDGSGRS
jgi:hypothetical protein